MTDSYFVRKDAERARRNAHAQTAEERRQRAHYEHLALIEDAPAQMCAEIAAGRMGAEWDAEWEAWEREKREVRHAMG